MTSNTRTQIQQIIAHLDCVFQPKMIASARAEELFEKKYNISDWIYCLYANDEQTSAGNRDYKDSQDWLIEQFYESKENVSYWDRNWTFDETATVYAKRFGKFCISKSGEYKLVSPEDFISSSDYNNQHKYVDLKIKRFEISDNSWFYFRGNKYLGTAFLTRIYFNFNYDFEKIVSFSKTLGDELNTWRIPFEYKFATKKTNRYDNGVLYTKREHYFVVFYLITKINTSRQYDNLFGEQALSFTKKTSLKGVCFGEEPPVRNSSFGRYRADIMADIYIDYYNNNHTKAYKLENFFFRKLAALGFSTRDFFRNPHSYYPYDFSIFRKKTGILKKPVSGLSDQYLTWALNIGKLICKQGIIINQKGKTNCHWLSIIEDELENTEYKLTDDSFEEGRLGIIFFLAKLYSYFPDEYLFKVICETVIKNITAQKKPATESYEWGVIQKTKKLLIQKSLRKNEKQSDCSENTALGQEIDKILSETNSYTTLKNEAPQPVINKGYSAIGLLLLAIYENDLKEIRNLECYFSKEALLKLINHIRF